MEGCIEHILKRHKDIDAPTFADIKKYYDENLHPDVINLSDKKVYKNVFHDGKWAGTFQFTEDGAQKFCERVKPDDIIEIAAITSTYRPGPLAAGVHEEYIEAKENPHKVKYINETHREITQETYGFLIFQEQIALLAHKLGGLTLDEGNLLRKILTKKGTGKDDKRSKLRTKFINGCAKKGISNNTAASMWSKFEYFSGYGFNKSHAVAYSIISYQCAWLWTYYPAEWMAALLDKEPEKKKEYAINIAKSYGFDIAPLNINKSGRVWEISEDGKTLIQPLSSVKGVGDAAIDQILEHRPFASIEHLLFTKEIAYGKLNKKALDALCRGGALNELIDERFTGGKHFWSAAVVDRPKTKKKFLENIELYREEGEFTSDEIIQFKTELTGVFPMSLAIDAKSIKQLEQKGIPPISEFDADLPICWFIPRKIVEKKTKKGKPYWVVEVIDSNNETTKIRCWGVNPEKDFIYINKPYMASLDYSPDWGLSTRSLYRSFRLIGINI
jgi:DNA polymerase III alpha subunit